MKLGYIGLGKMGFGMVERLLERRYEVVATDADLKACELAKKAGADVVNSVAKVISHLEQPRLVWLMIPHHTVDSVLGELQTLLAEGDVIIDGGNSPYQDSIRRSQELEQKGITFIDVGVSGGPSGARNGACLMVGSSDNAFQRFELLFKDIAAPLAYAHVGKNGAGHFVKMIHNGIEYGMMQALAEGFTVMKKSEFDLDLARIASVYNHASVIESRLVGWLKNAFEEEGIDLENISGKVSHTGEGKWTIEEAKRLGISIPVIESAFEFRIQSEDNPSYTGQIVSALRNQFGGHSVKKDNLQ